MSARGETDAPAGEVPPERLIAAALAAGALSPAEVVHDGVLVEQVGRSHTVHRVSVGNIPRFFVKSFGQSRGATDGSVARERAVLALAAERPAVASLVPQLWRWDGPEPVVATAAVPGAEAWTMDRLGGGQDEVSDAWQRLVAALAPPLAAFHRATRDLARPGGTCPDALQGPEPWALRLMDGDAPPELWATPALATLLGEAAADPTLVAGLRTARALWRPLAVVHADLKHDNVLVINGPEGLRARVVDWEMARLGDPAWDLAGLAVRLPLVAGDQPPWTQAEIAGAALLVRAYAQQSGLAAPPLARRLALYAGAVLLAVAIQHASTLPPGGNADPARLLVAKARATFRRADHLTADFVAQAA